MKHEAKTELETKDEIIPPNGKPFKTLFHPSSLIQ